MTFSMSELNKTSTKILIDEEVSIHLIYERTEVNIAGGRGGGNVCKRVRRSKESSQRIAS
jgi:hypothetical protein